MDKLKAAIQTKVDAALFEYGTFLNSYANRFVPIWTGKLRRTMKVEQTGIGEVIVSTGDASTKGYATAQYYDELRHAKDGNSLVSFQQQFSKGPMAKGRQTGSGQKAMYSRAYRLWVKFFNPEKLSAMWYHRALSDPDIKRRLKTAFLSKFK